MIILSSNLGIKYCYIFQHQHSKCIFKTNTIDPDKRRASIATEIQKIGDGQSGEFMKAFGVTLEKGSNGVIINLRHPPKIEYAQGKTASPRDVCREMHNCV